MLPPLLESLTFKDITEVYRTEKRSKNLTEIRKDFYDEACEYLEKLRRDTEEMRGDPLSLQVLSLGETIKKASAKTAQIFEIRAEKILLMALRVSCGGEADTGRLTKEENQLYLSTLAGLRECRSVLFSQDRRPQSMPGVQDAIPVADGTPEAEGEATVVVAEGPSDEPKPPQTRQGSPAESLSWEEGAHLVVRVLEDVPAFAGPEHDYHLLKEDVVILPTLIARALVSKGKAEEIKVKR